MEGWKVGGRGEGGWIKKSSFRIASGGRKEFNYVKIVFEKEG